MFLVVNNKPDMKRNKTGYIIYSSDSSPLNSRIKNKQVLNLFPMLGLIVSIKNIEQNIQENIVQRVFFMKSAFNFAPNHQNPTPTFGYMLPKC